MDSMGSSGCITTGAKSFEKHGNKESRILRVFLFPRFRLFFHTHKPIIKKIIIIIDVETSQNHIFRGNLLFFHLLSSAGLNLSLLKIGQTKWPVNKAELNLKLTVCIETNAR